MNRTAVGVILSVLVFTGCSQVPQWVRSGKSPGYPDDKYLVAIRDGDTPAAAKQNCRQALKSFFATEAERPESPLGRFRSSAAGGRKAVVNEVLKGLPETLGRAEDDVLERMRVVETWRDAVSAKVSTLAVIDRADAGEAIKGRLDAAGTEVKTALASAEAAADPAVKAGALRTALSALLAFDVWNSLRASVDPSGQGVPDPSNAEDILRMIRDASPALRVYLQVTGDRNTEVRESLEEKLLALGYDVVSSDPDVSLGADIRGTPQGSGEGQPPLTFISWRASVSLQDARTGRSLARFVERGRDGQPREDEAWNEAVAHIGSSLTKRCSEALVHFTAPRR